MVSIILKKSKYAKQQPEKKAKVGQTKLRRGGCYLLEDMFIAPLLICMFDPGSESSTWFFDINDLGGQHTKGLIN